MSSEDNSGYKLTIFTPDGNIPFEIVESKEGEEKSEVRLVWGPIDKVKEKLGWGTKENAIEPGVFEKEILKFVSLMNSIISKVNSTTTDYSLDTVEINAAVSVEGKIGLLGTGIGVTGTGGLTFTFKKNP